MCFCWSSFRSYVCYLFFFFKQKTAYEMRISDWSSDVCSSDLLVLFAVLALVPFIAQAIGEPFYIALFARIIIYAIAASALNLVLGYGGLVSFGHALFFGIGAYGVALPVFHGIDNGWVHLILVFGVCGVAAAVTGAKIGRAHV